MSGVALVFDVSDLARRSQQIVDLANFDTHDLLESIGMELAEQTRERLMYDKESPDGVPWVGWSDGYADTRHSGHSLLVSDGHLADSVQHVVGSRQVEVGSNLVYAAIHQFGGAAVGMSMPERPWLGISNQNEEDLMGLISDFFEAHLAQVLK